MADERESRGAQRRIAELETRVAELERDLDTFQARATEQMRGIANALPVMIAFVDTEQRFRFVNRAYEPWFGVPLDRIVGQRLEALMSPAEYATRLPYVRRALAGEAVEYEAEFHRASGLRRAVIHHIPLTVDGRVIGFHALIQDVTERWLMLERARESEARFRRIADSAPVPIWVTAPNRTREFVNAAYVAFLGVPYEQALLFDWRTILHPDDHDRVVAESIAGEASGDRFALEARYARADGEWRWIRSISQPRYNQAGMPDGFIGVAEDITAAKAAAAQAAAQAEHLRASVDGRTRERDRLWSLSTDAFVVCDMAGRWLSASPAWERLLGWVPGDLIGRTSAWIEHPDDHLPTEAARAMLREEGSVPPFTNRLRSADGSYRHLTWTAVADGDHAYCIARDVTDELARTDALRAVEDALRQSQKMEALGQLTGGVAHDFNNLLTPILGTLDLLLTRAEAGTREHRLVEGAHQSAVRARTLVQRLLAFARRQPLDKRATAIGPLVRGLEDLFRSTLGPAVALELDADDTLPPAMADPNQLEMALLNLVVNARDAMPDGGRIAIALAEVKAADASGVGPGAYLRLSVSDTGEGMDAETLRRATEPFFSTKASGAGTGLGLSMVHGLMGQLGGAMRIASEPGRGTHIELLLPVTDASGDAKLSVADTAAASGPLSVLLVDDEPLVRANTAAMLAELGHRVTSCGSGAEALELLGDGTAPDLLVTDQVMPGMTGVQLAAVARRKRPALPVLIVSGYPAGDEPEVMAGRLAKPFGLAELSAAVAAAAAG